MSRVLGIERRFGRWTSAPIPAPFLPSRHRYRRSRSHRNHLRYRRSRFRRNHRFPPNCATDIAPPLVAPVRGEGMNRRKLLSVCLVLWRLQPGLRRSRPWSDGVCHADWYER